MLTVDLIDGSMVKRDANPRLGDTMKFRGNPGPRECKEDGIDLDH